MTARVKLLVVAVVVLAACDKPPPKPEATAFAAMTPDQQCDATFPRVKTCIDELMAAEVASLTDDPALGDALGKDLGKTPTYKDEAEQIHRNTCLGTRDNSYPRDIVRCWDVTGCKAFAACVYQPKPKR